MRVMLLLKQAVLAVDLESTKPHPFPATKKMLLLLALEIRLEL